MPDKIYEAPQQDVVLSSRVRLARNYADLPFTPRMTGEGAEETVRRVVTALSPCADTYTLYRIKELPEAQMNALVERHLISYDLIKFKDWAAALISSGETVSVMVNEEDHLRIQGLLPGLQLEKAAELAFGMDDTLCAGGDFAFDAQWGYLTSCPTNTGTGMRASTMLHLPALHASGQLGALSQALGKLGMTVRGLYGEGSDAVGCMYQLSNQITLGRAEEDVIRSLIAATMQLAGHERATREQMRERDEIALTDRLMRSIGILRSARLMTSTEFMTRVSDLRMAAAMKLADVPLPEIDEGIKALQPSSLLAALGGEADARQVDVARADRLRAWLKDLSY